MKTIIVSLATVLAAGVAAAQPTDGYTTYRSTVLGDTQLAAPDSARIAAPSAEAAHRRFIAGALQADSEPRDLSQTSGYDAYRRTVLGHTLADAASLRGVKS
jgi:hypothetical protein